MTQEQWNDFISTKVAEDIDDFVNYQTDIDKILMRYWVIGENEEDEAYFGYFKHWINLGDGGTLVGILDKDGGHIRYIQLHCIAEFGAYDSDNIPELMEDEDDDFGDECDSCGNDECEHNQNYNSDNASMEKLITEKSFNTSNKLIAKNSEKLMAELNAELTKTNNPIEQLITLLGTLQ